MANNIGPKIGVQGEAAFKSEIASINTTLKTMSTEMDKVTASFLDNEDSVEALTAKNKLLSAKYDELSKKADVQRARLAELDAQGVDPTSASYQKLVQDLNKTEAEMYKTESAISKNDSAMGDLEDGVEDVGEAMEDAADDTKRMGDNLVANLLSEAIIGGIKALADGAKKLGSALLDAASAADELNTLSVKTGIATDQLQKFQYASETIDVSVDTLTGSMTKLTKNMYDARGGTGAAADAFKTLGVSLVDDYDNFKSNDEVFQETIAALGGIHDETKRDALAMEIFGKSAQELNPLILGGAEALQELGQHAEEAGLIMSQDDVNALSALNDRFGTLKSTFTMAGQQFLAQFAEPLTSLIDKVIGYVEKLVAAFNEGGFAALGETVGEIATDIAETATEYLSEVAEFATSLIMTLTEGLLTMLPSVVESASTILITLVTGLSDALPELIPVAVAAILTIVDTLTDPDNIGNMVDAAIAITIALASGLIDALPRLVEKAPEIIGNLVTSLVENAPKLLEAAVEVIYQLGTGIIDNLDDIGAAAGEIIATIISGVVDLATSLWETGKSIVEGIWSGISDAGAWLWEQVSGFFGGLIDNIKDFLGIHSPSKVFAGIGDNMALGIGVGFEKTMDKVERDMMSSMAIPDVSVNGTANTAAVMTGGSGIVEEITIPVMVGDVELARVLYQHIVGEGQRIGPAMVAG